MKFGLIGHPLSHSFSKQYFKEKFAQEGFQQHEYINFDIENIRELPELLKLYRDLVGLNVTIPYKRAAIQYLDQIEPVAKKIASVNTITIDRSTRVPLISGYNTDVIGFRDSLVGWMDRSVEQALIFGGGGSASSVNHVLKELGISTLQVTRQSGTQGIPYAALTPSILKESALWINCTPVGMFPHEEEELPLDFSKLGPAHFLFDLIYNPSVTRFLQHGINQGSKVKNGYEMLVLQAEASWRIWSSYVG